MWKPLNFKTKDHLQGMVTHMFLFMFLFSILSKKNLVVNEYNDEYCRWYLLVQICQSVFSLSMSKLLKISVALMQNRQHITQVRAIFTTFRVNFRTRLNIYLLTWKYFTTMVNIQCSWYWNSNSIFTHLRSEAFTYMIYCFQTLKCWLM